MEPVFGSGIAGLTAPEGADPLASGSTIGSRADKARYVHRDGQRYRTGGGPLGETKKGEADLLVWTSPGGMRILTHVIMACPRCEYFLVVPATQQKIVSHENNALTVRARIVCPAHWEKMDTRGHVSGRQKCGWSGVVREGHVHSLRCPCADFRNHHGSENCRCGGLLSESETDYREQAAQSARRGL
jgi:hypothetical protein